jgi:hypothetical protein
MKLLIIALVIVMAMPAQGADTQRTLSELQALLADNTTGNISPTDLRGSLLVLSSQSARASSTDR